MRITLAALVALVLIAGACGGSTTQAGPEPTSSPTVGPDEESPTPPEPEGLALTTSALGIAGDTDVLVVAGETIEVDHLVRNGAVGSLSLGFRVQTDDDRLEVELSTSSIRLPADEILMLTSELTVPTDVAVGETFEYEVIAVNVDDITQRSATTVQLLVTDAVGSRPSAGPDAGRTSTNQKVLVYVVGDDTDSDGDLDLSSVRFIAGGFLADEITGAGDGTITYVPFANVTGRDMLLYEVCDREDRCDTATVTIDIVG